MLYQRYKYINLQKSGSTLLNHADEGYTVGYIIASRPRSQRHLIVTGY